MVQLCVPLFEAVLEEDLELTRCLLRVGADPDLEAGGVVRGAVVRELKVTTARQLASTLGHNHILALFDKVSGPLLYLTHTLVDTMKI